MEPENDTDITKLVLTPKQEKIINAILDEIYQHDKKIAALEGEFNGTIDQLDSDNIIIKNFAQKNLENPQRTCIQINIERSILKTLADKIQEIVSK